VWENVSQGMNKIYVGNLKWSFSDQQLSDLFRSAGSVVSAVVIVDRNTGRSRGFGFVEMSSSKECQRAIGMLNGESIDGRTLIVKEALPENKKESVDPVIKNFIENAEMGEKYHFNYSEKKYIIIREN